MTEQAGRKAIQSTPIVVHYLSISVAIKDRALTPYVIYYFTAVKRRLAFEYPCSFSYRTFYGPFGFLK